MGMRLLLTIHAYLQNLQSALSVSMNAFERTVFTALGYMKIYFMAFTCNNYTTLHSEMDIISKKPEVKYIEQDQVCM